MSEQRFDAKRAAEWLRRYWVGGVAALFILVLLVGTPAWASPVARPLNQTVPRPTPTSAGDPVATATPRPDDDDDDDSGGGGAQPGDPSAPADNSDIFGQPGAGGAAPVVSYSATVDVATLNVRQGPAISFPVVGTLVAGDTVTVTARTEDATWWYICCATDTGAAGWVSAQLLTPSFDRAEAVTLLPLFGSESAQAAATPVPGAGAATTAPAGTTVVPEPLALDFRLDPPFVWQGTTGTLQIRIVNPNTVAVTRAQFSDELPAELTLLDVSADGGGTVEQIDTAAGRPLIIARWPTIPAGTSVSATIVFQVDSDLSNGVVIDNLVAVRGTNAAYQTGAVTIGMPPVKPPRFE